MQIGYLTQKIPDQPVNRYSFFVVLLYRGSPPIRKVQQDIQWNVSLSPREIWRIGSMDTLICEDIPK